MNTVGRDEPQIDNETVVSARRPSPVSPTSRARRASAAGVLKARRPSPTPALDTEGTSAVAEVEAAETAPAVAEVDASEAASLARSVAGRQRRSVRPAIAYGVALVTALLVAVNVALLLLPSHRGASQADREQVLAAAKTSTRLVISYDYRHVDADAATAVPHLTGSFAADYRKSIDSVIAVQAPKVKAVVEGQVDSAAIEAVSVSGDQVTVIVFGQQKVTNSSLSQPRTDLVRLRVTMDKVGGEWKIAQLIQI